MKDNSSFPKFKSLFDNADINNSIFIGTNQMIQGNLDNYPDLKNIISINFGACIGFFCYSDKKFLFIHTDQSSLKEALNKIDNFYQYNNKSFDTICFFNKGIKSSDETEKNLERIEGIFNKNKSFDKGSFKAISLNLRDNKRSFFDLFLDVSSIRNGQKLSYHYLEYDDDLEIDPYMPIEYKTKYQKYYPDSKGDNIEFYLNDEKQPLSANRRYLNNFISQARSKSPYRINKGFYATYDEDVDSIIKDISDFKQDLGEILCQAIENSNDEFIYWILSKTEINLNRAGKDGRVPLHAILDSKNIEINSFEGLVNLLINYGADINQRNQITGENLLCKALNLNEDQYAQFILDKIEGVKIDTKALIIAIENEHWNIVDSFLKQDDLLMDKEELDLNKAREDGKTPLIAAVAKNNYYNQSLIKKLLDRGVDPNQENKGKAPLAIAIENNDKEFVKILLATKGIKVNKNLLDQSLDDEINNMVSKAFKEQQTIDNFDEKFKFTTQKEYEENTKINKILKKPEGDFKFKSINPNLNLKAEDVDKFKIRIEKKDPETVTRNPSFKIFSSNQNRENKNGK